MRLSILFAVFIILFHGVASKIEMKAERLTGNRKHDEAARSFFERLIYRIKASETTDPQEKATFIRVAKEHERAAHRHLEGLGHEETKDFHQAKEAEHKAIEDHHVRLMRNATDPEERRQYEIIARTHYALAKVRNHLAGQHP